MPRLDVVADLVAARVREGVTDAAVEPPIPRPLHTEGVQILWRPHIIVCSQTAWNQGGKREQVQRVQCASKPLAIFSQTKHNKDM